MHQFFLLVDIKLCDNIKKKIQPKGFGGKGLEKSSLKRIQLNLKNDVTEKSLIIQICVKFNLINFIHKF